MTEHETRNDDDLREVMDNPEWSEADIRARRSLSDFAPELAENIARAIGRPANAGDQSKLEPSTKRRSNRPA